MVVTALAFVFVRNLFAVVMLSSVFSLTAALLYLTMDAVDVAFTEAAVGAGIATVLGVVTLSLVGVQDEKLSTRANLGPFMVVMLTGTILFDVTFEMPRYGDPEAPIHQYVAPRYINDSWDEIGVPNIVTAVLASYRGYDTLDTLGELVVIFTAACGVSVLLGRRRRRSRSKDNDSQAREGEK